MVLGRVAERAAITQLLGEARERRSGSLLLTGDPGIGKSTLLEFAVASAREQGFSVLTARGYESESTLSFAALADLLKPVLPLLMALPEPQTRALQSALSLGPPVAGDRFSVCTATIGMLAAAAEHAPLLVAVDDAHWLDPSSREAVLFTARRLNAEGIALLLASRAGTGRDGEYAGVRTLRLDALSRADADLLFDRLSPTVPAQLRREIYDDAAGNPLGIRELFDRRGREQISFAGQGIPSDSRLARALSGRLADLPGPTRIALLLVAAAGSAPADVVLAAAARRGLGLADFAPAEEAGLLLIGERRIEFRHPLMRSLLYGTATTHARATAHAALADVLEHEPGDVAADVRAWHLAVARLPPDEETATLLDATGLRARRRGGYLEAARALEQAARFGSAPDRPARLLRAARAWQLAGRTGRIAALVAEALPLAVDPGQRARLVHLEAHVRMWRRQPADALSTMIAAAGEVAEVDTDRAALMYADAASACFMLGRITDALPLITRAYQLGSHGSDAARHNTAVVMAGILALHGRRAEAAAQLAAVRAELIATDPLTRAQEYGYAAFTCIWLEDYTQAADWLGRMTDRVRSLGAVGLLPQALGIASELSFRLGRWGESVAFAAESTTLAAQTRQAELYGRFFVARMQGLQGQVAECLAGIEEITRTSRRLGVGCMDPYTGHIRGLIALAAGDLDDAVRQLEAVRDLPMSRQVTDQGVIPWAYDLVEAYVRCGRTADAGALLASVAPAPDDPTHQWQHAVAARCRGLLAPREAMAAEFERALNLHATSDLPFEQARTRLCFGERLRRDRQRGGAREHLRAALETFERLGATVWADRARAELTATGETLPRGPGLSTRLTPQELQVAMVVARGATNQEAAAALFLSPKTIEYHLSNIYKKTQLHSRGELAVLAARAS